MNNTFGTSLQRRNQHNLTVQNVVENVMKKTTFGFDGYNPKAMVKDLCPCIPMSKVSKNAACSAKKPREQRIKYQQPTSTKVRSTGTRIQSLGTFTLRRARGM